MQRAADLLDAFDIMTRRPGWDWHTEIDSRDLDDPHRWGFDEFWVWRPRETAAHPKGLLTVWAGLPRMTGNWCTTPMHPSPKRKAMTRRR